MPISSFRSWVGFAKANASTYTTAATAIGATSIPVNGTVVPASSTIYFIDGQNSETGTVSAGGGSSTLTVSATTFAHSANCPIYYQLTAGLGPVDYMPVTALDQPDTIAYVSDAGVRGSNVASYGQYQVAGQSDITFGGDVIYDTFGYLLGSVFGAVDFSGGSPNTHTFAGMNTAASNGQPTELMIWVYNGYNTRLYVGCKASELVIKFDPMQLVTWTTKFEGFLSMVYAGTGSTPNISNPTSSFSAITPQGAWQAAMTVAGTSIPALLTCDYTFKRTTMEAIHTLQSNQSPYKIWAGSLETTGNLNFVMEDDTILAHYLKNDQPATVTTLTNGTGATQVQIQIQSTKTNFVAGWKPKVLGGKGYVEVGGPINCVANTTDGNTAGTAYSPSRVVLKNAVATGHYQ